MGKYAEDVKQLLTAVGGKENISAVSHCMTRMRFVLADPKKADEKAIEEIQRVKGTFTQAGQFQVIIGNDVAVFYNEFTAYSGIEGVSKDAVKAAAKTNQEPVFWCNHDQPRVVSRFGNEKKYWKESAKMLGTVIHCMRGTPYIYQGEELGMTNPGFTHISQYRDVESLNHFRILQEKGISEEAAYQILSIHSRDNSRTPMQWTAGEQAGFTAGEPWIQVTDNHTWLNAEAEEADADSILNYYKKLVRLRKEYEVIACGDLEPLDVRNPSVLAYRRRWKEEELLVICNFYGKEVSWDCGQTAEDFACILGNYSGQQISGSRVALRPYECMVLYKNK